MFKLIKPLLKQICYPLIYLFYKVIFDIKFVVAFRRGELSHLRKEDLTIW